MPAERLWGHISPGFALLGISLGKPGEDAPGVPTLDSGLWTVARR